jgi:GTP-binding protein
MFVDIVEIKVEGGHGGAGIVSFGKRSHSGPDGGSGGKGGNIYMEGESDLTLLGQFSRKTNFIADAGYPGGANKRTGKNGNDLLIKIPVGTTVVDKQSGKTIFEFNIIGQKELICYGGKGGKGNYEFRSSRRTTPEFAQPGLRGEKKDLVLNLKLIADFGLIGLPNAGKSSLLNELTKAKAKIANYPFTTLSPNLGVFDEKIIADIPGLIEGASTGRGLGISFLKHIEKVKVLLHCISSESNNPAKDYKIIRDELIKYNKKLVKKHEIILITKSDLVEKKELNKFESKLENLSKDMCRVSIHDWESLEKLKLLLREYKH